MTAPLHTRRIAVAPAEVARQAADTTPDPSAADEVPSGASTLSQWPAIVTVVAGAVLLDGAVMTAAYRGSSPVTKDQFSFPWHGATAITTSLVWGAAQALMVVGLVAFARRHASTNRLGRAGARLAITGGIAFVAAHLVSVFAYDATTDDPAAITAMTLFGLGTLAMAAGLLVAGAATRRPARPSLSSSRASLALGGWMVVMIPLQFTAALAVAVSVYALLVITFGVSLLERRSGAVG